MDANEEFSKSDVEEKTVIDIIIDTGRSMIYHNNCVLKATSMSLFRGAWCEVTQSINAEFPVRAMIYDSIWKCRRSERHDLSTSST